MKVEDIMHLQDLSQNRRIARLAQLTRELEQSQTPEDTLRILERGFAEVDGFVASLLLSTRGLSPGHYRVVGAQLKDEPLSDLPSPAKEEPGPVRRGGILRDHQSPRAATRPGCRLVARPVLPRDAQRVYVAHGDPAYRRPSADDLGDCAEEAPQQFTASDLEEAVERVALVGALLENQMLASELAANEQIDRDARRVGELQRALLPASLPRIAGLEIAASYAPLGRAGGDLYDVFPLDERQNDRGDVCTTPSRWCIFIGDVEGHGLAAALVMAIVQAVLHAHPAEIARPASLLMHANRQLCAKRIDGFVTAFLGIYEPASRRLVYAKAGHPPPLLRRAADGSIGALDAVGSCPLGIDGSETFQEAAVQLERDDALLLYTDGITECRATRRPIW